MKRLGILALQTRYGGRPRLRPAASCSFYRFHTSSRNGSDLPPTEAKPLVVHQAHAAPTTPEIKEETPIARLADEEKEGDDSLSSSKPITDELIARLEADLTPEQLAGLNEWKAKMDRLHQQAMSEAEAGDEPDPKLPYKKFSPGLLAMGEPDAEDVGEDESFKGDDMTSTGHAELEQHRELREYARIAAWEMPLLSKFAKPFELPPSSKPLRFRYTDYMGETHPAAKKVVVEFCTLDLPLEPSQRLKLVKLLGARYNPQRDLAKLSCEMFETQAQNKRYLGDLVDTLVAHARGQGVGESEGEGGSDSELAKDAFADVPPDFRHVRWKRELKFPVAWELTPAKREAIEADRAARAAAENARIENGALVDGRKLIEEAAKNNRLPVLEHVRAPVSAPKSRMRQRR